MESSALPTYDRDAIENVVRHIRPIVRATEQHRIRPEANERRSGTIVGNAPAFLDVLRQVEIVAPTDATVLVHGETGTGKELVARAIHDQSSRRHRPFVKINCAAIPSGLLESELFGHERGAFTGAIAQRTGRFEQADGGTLFLDEVGEIPLELQPKLLRVLQEQEFERIGGTRTLTVDVRVIAATNRELAVMVDGQQFRDDLYYRLNVFPIAVPPLRERTEDIDALVHHFVEHFARRMGRRIEVIPKETMDAFRQYGWPGNVRELENLIHRSVILSPGPRLTVPAGDLELPRTLRSESPTSRASEPAPVTREPNDTSWSAPSEPETLRAIERAHIMRVLVETNWMIGGPRGAAARLGLKRTTLQALLKRLELTRPRDQQEEQRV